MPKNTARIGKDDEREIVKDLEKRGYQARRQPGSGNRAVDLQGDVVWLNSPVGRLTIEAKYREICAWKTLDKWRAGQDVLSLRCDDRRKDQDGTRLVVMSWELFLDLVGDKTELAVIGVDMAAGPDYSVEADIDPTTGKIKRVRKATWPKREIRSKGFDKGHRPMRKPA